MTSACCNCRYFVPHDQLARLDFARDGGECRVNPPVARTYEHMGAAFGGLFPVVRDDDWCARFVHRGAAFDGYDVADDGASAVTPDGVSR